MLSKYACTGFLILGLVRTSLGDALDNWTRVTTSPYGGFTQVIYANGQFAAISTLSPANMYPQPEGGLSTSKDGVNWIHSGVTDVPSGITFGNGVFVRDGWAGGNAFGDYGFLLSSTNATNLTNDDFYLAAPTQYGVTFGSSQYTFITTNIPPQIISGTNTTFVAVGYCYECDLAQFLTSSNGVSWTTQPTAISNFLPTAVACNGSTFVAVGAPNYPNGTNALVYTSGDATNWSLISATSLKTFTGNLSYVTAVNGAFYATQYNYLLNPPTRYFASSTGKNWAATNPPFPSHYVQGNSNQGTYISVNSSSNLYTSHDRLNWTLRNTGITNIITCVTSGDNCFIVCAADGSIFKSGSIAPSLAGASVSNGGFRLTVNGGLGPAFQLQASSNLLTWSNLFTFTNIEVSNQFVDMTTSNYPARYYRLVSQ